VLKCESLLLSTVLSIFLVCSIILLEFPLLSDSTASSGNTSSSNTTTATVNSTATAPVNATIAKAQIEANATIAKAQSQANATIVKAQSQANATIAAAAFSDLPASITGMLAAAIVLVLAVPILADLLLAHYRQYKLKTIDRPLGMAGLYRSLMAFGLIAVVSVLVVYLVALVSFYIAIQSPAAQALISVLQNLAAILGTALATVIAFYFGIRGVENATDRALAAVGIKSSGTKGEGDQTGPPKIIGRYPADGQHNVKINSDIVVTFNKQIDGSTITKDTFLVRKDGTNVNKEAEEIKLLVENQAIFKPRDDFEKNTKYIIKMIGEVKDKFGNKMLSDETWSFITMA
jgi:hypothetical protein